MLYPIKFLNDFAELIDSGCIPDIQIEAKNTTSLYDINKIALEYQYRRISINYKIDGVDYEMFVEYDKRFSVFKEWVIGTKNSQIEVYDSESLDAIKKFMNKYCNAENEMDVTVNAIKKEFVNKHTN